MRHPPSIWSSTATTKPACSAARSLQQTNALSHGSNEAGIPKAVQPGFVQLPQLHP